MKFNPNYTMKKIILSMLVAAAGLQANAQFQQNFDSATTLPTGWAAINAGDPNEWIISSSIVGGAHSGANAASIAYHSTIAHDDYFITPAITVAEGVNTRLSFWIKSRSTSFLEPYQVVLSTTNNTSAAAFNIVVQPEIEAPATWTKNTFNLSDYVGQTVYVAIRATGLDEFNLYADDFVSDAFPSCAPTENLAVSAITATSATLEWASNAANFQYALGQSTTTDPNSVTAFDVPGATTANLTLQPSTTYKVWVRSICDDGPGDWTEPISFTTACAPIAASALPWTEGFENVASVGTTSFPNCWLKENGDWRTANAGSSAYDANAYSGSQFASIQWTADNEFLWTPGFDLVANQAYDFSFWFSSYGEYEVWAADVFVNTAQSSANAFAVGTPFASVGTVAPNVYTQVTRTFTPAADGTYFFAIRVNEETGSPWYLSFDDFKLQSSSLSASEATLDTFKFYPNPVKNVLNISNSDVIQTVEVYNIVGQNVMAAKFDATQASLDFSSLQSGTYIVKAATANAVKTFKIAKQ